MFDFAFGNVELNIYLYHLPSDDLFKLFKFIWFLAHSDVCASFCFKISFKVDTRYESFTTCNHIKNDYFLA